MKSWNGQEVICITEILTLRVQWGAGADPGGLEWKDLRLVLAEPMGGRSGKRGRRQIGPMISEFYRKGVDSPAHCDQK